MTVISLGLIFPHSHEVQIIGVPKNKIIQNKFKKHAPFEAIESPHLNLETKTERRGQARHYQGNKRKGMINNSQF